jgi:2,4-dienoyl-CoA reductase-like NADH-dependent reductase (Old Yellow Enzyme family)
MTGDGSIPTLANELFGPVVLGPCRLANRIVMAPLTRARADADGVPGPLMAEYYARRASAGLIIGRLRRAFRGLYVANNGYDLALALEARRLGRADLTCFGRPFIANPDLVDGLRRGAPLAQPDRKTFYAAGGPGYTGHPVLGATAG